MSKFDLICQMLFWADSRRFWAERSPLDEQDAVDLQQTIETRTRWIRETWDSLNKESQKTADLYKDLL